MRAHANPNALRHGGTRQDREELSGSDDGGKIRVGVWTQWCSEVSGYALGTPTGTRNVPHPLRHDETMWGLY